MVNSQEPRHSCPTLWDWFAKFQRESRLRIRAHFSYLFTGETALITQLPLEYIAQFSATQDASTIDFIWLVCILVYHLFGGKLFVREMQLHCLVATYVQRCNTIIISPTGSGKSLPLLVWAFFLDPGDFLIEICPLESVQALHAQAYLKAGVPAVSINGKTPTDNKWWKKNIHDPDNKEDPKNYARLLIVTAEQLFRDHGGHYTKIGKLVRSPKFLSRLKFLVIDECHNIKFSGTALYCQPAIRPSWGKLSNLQAILPVVPWCFFTATLPKHAESMITEGIPRPLFIRYPNHRSNIAYATHLVDSVGDPKNYGCFIKTPFNFHTQPKVLILVPTQSQSIMICQYLINHHLPEEWQAQDVVMHYHSIMSAPYKDRVNLEFKKADSKIRVLVATSGQGTGVDHDGVDIVCTDAAVNTAELQQRLGRSGRSPGSTAIGIIFYKPWMLDIDASEWDKHPWEDTSNLDRPREPSSKKYPTPQDRVSISAINLIKSLTCIREEFALYNGEPVSQPLEFKGAFCCNCHGPGFRLQDYLPGPIYHPPPPLPPAPKTGPKNRPVAKRKDLQKTLKTWRCSSFNRCMEEDEWIVTHPHHILTDAGITKLVTAPRTSVDTPEKVTTILNASKEWADDWAAKVAREIAAFDKEKNPAFKETPEIQAFWSTFKK